MESDIDNKKSNESEADIYDWIALIGLLVFVFYSLHFVVFVDTKVYEFDCDGDGDYDIQDEVTSTEDRVKPDRIDIERACNLEPRSLEAYDTDIDWRTANSE